MTWVLLSPRRGLSPNQNWMTASYMYSAQGTGAQPVSNELQAFLRLGS